MRIVAFHELAFDQYNEWALTDKKAFERLRRLISEAAKTPFAGIGKPEPLKRDLKGYCSSARREFWRRGDDRCLECGGLCRALDQQEADCAALEQCDLRPSRLPG